MNIKQWTAAGISALMLAGAALTPALAQENKGRQRDKNNMRNLGIGLGAAAAHQAIKGKGTNALILGAGAAYSGKKYEDARKAQSRESRPKYGRVYKYSNGKRVGYWRTVNGKKQNYVNI